MTWPRVGGHLCLFLMTILAGSAFAKPNFSPHPDASGNDILARCDKNIQQAKDIRNQIYHPQTSQQNSQALELYNEISIVLGDTLSEASLIAQVHPNEAIRKDAETCEQNASKFSTELSLDKKLYDALVLSDGASEDYDRARVLERTLRDFRRSGVDKDDATRDKIKTLKEELVTISQQFAQNISNDRFFIELNSVEELDGLPADYIESHRTETGKYVIDTTYPDYFPFMKYAKNDAARRELRFKYLNRGEKNGPVLDALIEKRHELARLLGYDNFAEYIVEDKMIKTPGAIHDFINKISNIAKAGADREYQELLDFKERSIGESGIILGHESSYLEESYKKERFGFDSQEVRSYFPYLKVRDGLLDITGELFGISYKKIEDAKVWHQSVDVYDVYDGNSKLGRIYLDMHPRDGKYSHAAQFTLRNGIRDRQYPEGVLVCNFPNPKDGDGSALMEYGDVSTLFHEFGHLLHHVFAGRHKWATFSGVATEWDFVEAPSQLLEEWAWDPGVLARFAHHYQSGDAISSELVGKLRAAEEFGKAIAARQQMFYAALSAGYYDSDPADFDVMELLKQLQAQYSYYPYEEGTHFNYNFGHLDGYSAMYYTYMWSLSLAKDLFEPFKAAGIMNKDVARRYRDIVLSSGGSRDAAALVEAFLGRPFQFDAFEKWLTSDPLTP